MENDLVLFGVILIVAGIGAIAIGLPVVAGLAAIGAGVLLLGMAGKDFVTDAVDPSNTRKRD